MPKIGKRRDESGMDQLGPSERQPRNARAHDPVTMKDIALAAGVSQSTVSRVLNDTASLIPIAADTRTRILDAAERLRYRPNPLARGLRGARTMLLGAIVRDITDPFFAAAIEAVSTSARGHGYNIVLGHAHGRADEAMALRAVLETRHCDAILLLGDMRDQPLLIDDLRGSRVPIVAMWQGSRLSGIPSVNVDNRWGTEAALAHVVDCGHRRIAFISGRSLGDRRERQRAFVNGVRDRGLPLPEHYVQHTADGPEGGVAAISALFGSPHPPTAVIAANDQLAVGALRGAFMMGLRVPDDLSVVGFDDIPLSAFTVPSLTTVRMPMQEMADLAVQKALGAYDSSGLEQPISQVIRPTLVIRESTGAPRATNGHVLVPAPSLARSPE